MPEENALVRRIMPHSPEAEQAVIGSMIADRDAIAAASEVLTEEDFYQQQYGALFSAICELHNEGQPADVVTLQARLRKKNLPEEIASVANLSAIVAAVPYTVNVRSYARIVREKALLREIIKIEQTVSALCYEDKVGVDAILEEMEKSTFALLTRRSLTDFVPISEIVVSALSRIEAASRTRGTVTGVATGFIDLDYQTAGLQPSDLVLIAARPSMGKTAFALNIAQYVCLDSDRCAAIFSLEMSKEQLVNRLFSQLSHIDAQKLRTGNLQDREWGVLVDSAGVIGQSRLIIDDTPGISISELRSKCRKYKLEYGLDIIFIDYLQLMSGGARSESRQQEISEISRALKALARELQVPVVALSQLSRAVESRPDKRPLLSDLRESGAIEQDADVVMFLYREDYYNKDTERKNISEVIIAKQRNGPVGSVELAWLPQYTRFGNLEHRKDSY